MYMYIRGLHVHLVWDLYDRTDDLGAMTRSYIVTRSRQLEGEPSFKRNEALLDTIELFNSFVLG